MDEARIALLVKYSANLQKIIEAKQLIRQTEGINALMIRENPWLGSVKGILKPKKQKQREEKEIVRDISDMTIEDTQQVEPRLARTVHQQKKRKTDTARGRLMKKFHRDANKPRPPFQDQVALDKLNK
jgi:hypothetical protein